MTSRHILCLDDQDTCQLYGLLLAQTDNSLVIIPAASPQEAIDLIKNQSFDLYILEARLWEMDGVEFCRMIRETDPQTPILFYSGMAREIDRVKAIAAGANAYLVKPNDLNIFAKTVKRLLKKWH